MRSMPAVRARLEGTRGDPDDLLDVTFLSGSSPLLLAYADLFSPAMARTQSGVRLAWDGYGREFRDGVFEDIADMVGRPAPEPVPDVAIAGIVAHFWTVALRARGGQGRFCARPSGLSVKFVAHEHGVGGASAVDRDVPRSEQPLGRIFKSAGVHAKARFGLARGEDGAFLRELRSLKGDSLLIPVYASLLSPVVDEPECDGWLRFLHAKLCHDPLHVDLLHGCKTDETEDFLRAAGETVAYFWTLQLQSTGRRGLFVYDESEGMDVVFVEDAAG